MRTRLSTFFVIIGLFLAFYVPQARAQTSLEDTLKNQATTSCPKLADGSDDPNCYVLLAPLPLTNPSNAGNPDTTTNPSDYIRGLLNLAIAIAGAVAVIKIIIGGFQYITTENFSNKSSARSDIQNALVGLFLAIGAYTILYTINPHLVDLQLTVSPVETSTALDQKGACAGPVAADGTCSSTSLPPGDTLNTDGTANCKGRLCSPTQSFNFPQKGPGTGCGGTTCYVDQILGQKLSDLTTRLQTLGIDGCNSAVGKCSENDWIVTEMYPPSVSHASDCHSNGTCVDAALIRNAAGKSSGESVALFLGAIGSTVSPSFLYEVPSCLRLSVLQNDPALSAYKQQIKFCKTTTGESVHINLTGGTGGSCGFAADGSSNEVKC